MTIDSKLRKHRRTRAIAASERESDTIQTRTEKTHQDVLDSGHDELLERHFGSGLRRWMDRCVLGSGAERCG
ncbi:hypothetical protein Y032_0371g119 [Ancylostoma ceylanicum]|uniref:Uncharacterized protein n=1 Tax=Ancylostoma ceylanicum TaxID=53326 RepID=A0A016RU47_9BILA|nr:hypothetical protein Y032_0371g119 [Ancylostoma ceylanicum]